MVGCTLIHVHVLQSSMGTLKTHVVLGWGERCGCGVAVLCGDWVTTQHGVCGVPGLVALRAARTLCPPWFWSGEGGGVRQSSVRRAHRHPQATRRHKHPPTLLSVRSTPWYPPAATQVKHPSALLFVLWPSSLLPFCPCPYNVAPLLRRSRCGQEGWLALLDLLLRCA